MMLQPLLVRACSPIRLPSLMRSCSSGAQPMDLPDIQAVARPRTRDDLPPVAEGSAWLAGGTWLFSEPQPGLRRLVDLTGLGWPALEPSAARLRIGATCTIAALEAFAATPGCPADWLAAPLFGACSRALLGSFKVWAAATVGGNVCLSLPAAPMLALTVALDGAARVWRPDGTERLVPMAGFTTGPQRTVLAPGELLRCIDLPAAALHRRGAVRQASLTRHGRSAALLVATMGADGFALTITASTVRPLHAAWPVPPSRDALDSHVQAIPPGLWFDDVHGAPAWRRHMTRRLASELHEELLG
jgi:CO/xanthine dehydrogenase FAD-binding subunit